MKKVICYIDGYNVYHQTKNKPSARIDFHALAQSLALEDQMVNKVHYFSALAKWKRKDYIQHQSYISQLEDAGVVVTLSKFRSNSMSCRECNTKWTNHEEKETDVRLSLEILKDAVDGNFDTAFVFSGDSDIAPAIRMVKQRYPDKKIILVLPKHQVEHSREMQSVTDGLVNLSESRIKKYMFEKRNEKIR